MRARGVGRWVAGLIAVVAVGGGAALAASSVGNAATWGVNSGTIEESTSADPDGVRWEGEDPDGVDWEGEDPDGVDWESADPDGVRWEEVTPFGVDWE